MKRIETKLTLYKSRREEKMERIKRAILNTFTNKKRKEKKYMEIAIQGYGR